MTEMKDIDTRMKTNRISLIAAIGKNRGLGKGGKLLFYLPDDLQHFKRITLGHPVIMGQRTWESLPEKFRPLPGRTNIVLSDRSTFTASGALIAHSLQEGFAEARKASGGDEVFIVGGGMVYAAALPFADRLYLTLVDAEADADTFFPQYEKDFSVIENENGVGLPPHHFLILERKTI
ncbi:MAG: dihydrofolate reductase [Candidatus Pacebacteria bacterium]|nr:dihydrofolate reductase [Candidatus Paceibacterota bacterium]